jgi:uncharacterized protein (DUF2267 family)
MSATGLEVFDETLQLTNLWLKEIETELGPDRKRAYEALRGVLHVLRDRLSVDEAMDLSAQLPMLVRGIYFEGYDPTGKPERVRDRDEFLARIAGQFRNIRPLGPDDAARAVFGVLGRHVDPGEVRQVIQSLPAELRTLWPGHERLTAKETARQ